ncbi:MAG: arsenical pump-driving ATPase [Propionibacteriaceae bacterium]|nr:arsenical pump-driving ATPase [Propionibacteriaceae bacterium]
MHFLTVPTPFFFFTGKGGVGKTSVACATAVELADRGRRVLLVSTDPASNVGQVFDTTIGNTITPIRSVPGLDALEIDPEEAAEAYRERILAPVANLLPAKDLQAITEQLSGSCTTEIASFNEFTELLSDTSMTEAYDHVIFDTAPTGHTIRLLQLPGEWTSFLDAGKGDASCLGPMSGLDKQRSTYRAALDALKDPRRTRLILVARAQESTLAELGRTQSELADAGIVATHLVLNGVLPDSEAGDLADAIHAREHAATDAMPEAIARLSRDVIGLKPMNMVGLPALRGLMSSAPTPAEVAAPGDGAVDMPGLAAQIDRIEADGRGLVMTMGKGGVGKTTVASAIAVALANRGHDVLLTTTDPAAHVSHALADGIPTLEVSSINPEAATRQYREHVMATKGRDLDDAGREALAEDLMSPCTEEIAVFQQFSDAVRQARRRFVIMDTAPTGHTLLLMDATGSYHRDIARHMDEGATFTTPLMRLQDPAYTKVIIVTLPETTPILEAQDLQSDLERAGIHPWAWVVNNSLAAAQPTSALLSQRATAELSQLATVARTSDRVAVIATQIEEPATRERLVSLTASQE